jgi:hypothetical protein
LKASESHNRIFLLMSTILARVSARVVKVFKEAWEAAGNTEPPVFAGHTFNDMEDDPNTEVDEAHGLAPHYDLHVWVFRQNPNGAFEPFNPAVSCEHAPEGGHGH